MLALVTDDEGRIVTLHRTYLTPEGIKAPVEAPKKLYAGGARGGLIRLGEPSDVLGIAEGTVKSRLARARVLHAEICILLRPSQHSTNTRQIIR